MILKYEQFFESTTFSTEKGEYDYWCLFLGANGIIYKYYAKCSYINIDSNKMKCISFYDLTNEKQDTIIIKLNINSLKIEEQEYYFYDDLIILSEAFEKMKLLAIEILDRQCSSFKKQIIDLKEQYSKKVDVIEETKIAKL